MIYKKYMVLFGMLVAVASSANVNQMQDTSVDVLAALESFELVEERDNIALYERWFSYDSTIKAREIKVVFEVNTGLKSAVNLLRDKQKADQWNCSLAGFEIVQQNTNRWINYARYDVPWPFADQDCVLSHTLHAISPLQNIISFETVTYSSFPIRDNVERMSGIKGYWKLTQKSESVHIEYTISTTPSKTLPRWVTDPIIRNNLLTMMVKFRDMLEELNY